MRRRPRATTDEGRPKPQGTARDRALRLITVRWRSRSELQRRLSSAGFEPGEIEEALAGLERAGLIDDSRFADEVVKAQTGRRHASDRAIRSMLWQKGVPADVAEEAVSETGGDESERARALAESRASRMGALQPETAFRRLYGLLLRRGYGSAVARTAARDALAGGFDPDSIPEPEAAP